MNANKEEELYEKEALLYHADGNLLAEWDMIDQFLKEGEKSLTKKENETNNKCLR